MIFSENQTSIWTTNGYHKDEARGERKEKEKNIKKIDPSLVIFDFQLSQSKSIILKTIFLQS